MSVSAVGGDGSLNFTANIDLGNADAQLDSLGNKLVETFLNGANANKTFNESIINSLKTAGASFDPAPVNEWSDAIKKAAASMQDILSKASSGLDPSKLQALNQEVAGTTGTFKQLSDIIDFIKQNIGSLKLNPEDSATLAESIKTIETSFDGFTEKTVKATTQIRALKNEMALMEDKGSPQFLALASQAGTLQKEVDESNKSVQLLASTTGGLQAGVQVLRGVVGGFEAVAGAVGLASGKSEEMAGIVSSIISAMGILNGINEVADVINKRSALNQFLLLQYRRLTAAATTEDAVATAALAEAEGGQIIATEGAAVATAELNAVMLLNPAFLVVAAIAALAAGIYFLTQKSHEADQAATLLNKTLLDQYNVSNQIFELSKFAANQQIAAGEAGLEFSKAQNLSQKELIDQQIKLDKLKQDQAARDVKKAQDDLTGAASEAKRIDDASIALVKLSGITRKPLDLGFVTSTDIPTLIKNLNALELKLIKLKDAKNADKNKDVIEHLSSSIDLIKPKIEAYITSLTNLSSVSAKTTTDSIAQVQKTYSDSIKSFTAAQEAKTVILGQSQDKQLELTLASIRAQAAAQLDPKLNPDLTTGEKQKIQAESLKSQADAVFQFNQKQAADQAKFLQSQAALQKEGSKERLDFELQAIQVSTRAQLQQQILLNGQVVQYRQLSANQIASITNDSNKKIADLNKGYNKGVADDALETAIANDKTRLASATLTSFQEFQTKKKLIDDQQALDITNAQFTINNQELLAAKIKEINAESAQAKQKLEDEQLQNTLENNLKLIKNAAETAKAINNAVLADPNSSAKAKTNATHGNLIIDAEAIKKQMDEITAEVSISLLAGNANVGKQVAQLQTFAIAYQAALALLAKPPKGNGEDVRILNQTGGQISQLGNNLKQYNSSLGEVFISLGGIAKNAATVVRLFDDINKKKNTTEEQIASGLEATIQLISEVVAAGAARARAESDFNSSLIAQQEAYNLALNDSILLNNKLKDNVFVTNFQGEITDSIAALNDAQVKFQASLAALAQGQAKAGTKSVASGTAILAGVGSGVVTGAEIGGFLGPEGALIGGAIGAVVGGIVGFFGGKKPADKYVALLSAYPDLLQKGADGVTHINTALAQSLIANNQLSDSTKVLVQDTLDWQKAIDAANQQLKDVISTLAGSLGQDLSDSLVKAFEDGTAAGKAFADSVSKTLQQVVQQLLFNQVFGKAFDDLQAKLQASFQTGGTQDWQGALESFFNQYSGLTQTFDDALKTAQTEAQKAGLDIFQSTNAANGLNNNSLSGAIKGITETQADLLAGQFGGLRITAIDQLKTAQQSMAVLNEIAFNTAMLLDVKNTLNYFKLNGMKVI